MPRPLTGDLTPEENRSQAEDILAAAFSRHAQMIHGMAPDGNRAAAVEAIAHLTDAGLVDWAPTPPGYRRYEHTEAQTVVCVPDTEDRELNAVLIIEATFAGLDAKARVRVLNLVAARASIPVAVGRPPAELMPASEPPAYDPHDEPF